MNPTVWRIDRQMQVLYGFALDFYINTVERHAFTCIRTLSVSVYCYKGSEFILLFRNPGHGMKANRAFLCLL